MSTTLKIFHTCFAALFLVFFLSGCDQLRSTMQSVFKPNSTEEPLQSAQTALAAGDYKKAISEAEKVVQQGGQNQGESLLLIARSAARAGNIDQALVYLQKAMQAGAIQPTDAMLAPDFEAMRTDPRFLSMVAGVVASAPSSVSTPVLAPAVVSQKHNPPLLKPTMGASTGDVSAQVGEDGVSARAGDVSVRIAP